MTGRLISFLFSRFWKYRHLFNPGWETGSLAKVDFPQTAFIAGQVLSLAPASVLEFGCSSGSNLIALKRLSPGLDCAGMDISASAVAAGNRYAAEAGLKGLVLRRGDQASLAELPDSSVDVCFAAAVLLYLDSAAAGRALAQMLRVCTKGLVLVEQPSRGASSEFEGKKWYHPYADILRGLPGAGELQLKPIPAETWPGAWSARGRVFLLRKILP